MTKFACVFCIAIGLGVGTAQAATPDCRAISSKMLDHLDKGDYAGATVDFNDRMKTDLGPDRLAKIWPAVGEQFGQRGTREKPSVSQLKGYALVVTPLHYGEKLIDAKVACDADGKVAGFYIKPEQ